MTNACSLPAKLDSCAASLKELDLNAFLITETFLTDRPEIKKRIRDFVNEHRMIWSEWRLTVIAATVRIALVDILDLSEVDIPAGGFLYPAVGWG